MKLLFGILLCAVGIFGALYISIWWGIIQPIYSICQMVDAHTIGAMNIAGEVVKFIVRDIIAVVWGIIWCWVGLIVIGRD
jgi:hypothetical protein